MEKEEIIEKFIKEQEEMDRFMREDVPTMCPYWEDKKQK